MLVSFLFASLPAFLMLSGGILAAGGALHIAVSVPATKRPSHKGGASVALGLAMVIVTLVWNEVLGSGFALLRIDPEAPLLAQENGTFGDDLAISAQVLMITLAGVALATVLLAMGIETLQRAVLARPASPPDAPTRTPQPSAPAAPAAEGAPTANSW